jgi:hypothetical protein
MDFRGKMNLFSKLMDAQYFRILGEKIIVSCFVSWVLVGVIWQGVAALLPCLFLYCRGFRCLRPLRKVNDVVNGRNVKDDRELRDQGPNPQVFRAVNSVQ